MMGADGFANGMPHLADVASYREARASSGTQNQAGNVLEWVEDAWNDGLRMALGGSVFMYPRVASASYRDGERPDHRLSTLGFRVARITGGHPVEQRGSTSLDRPPLEFVRVDFAGNEPDPNHGFGAVGYAYEMQRTEISNADYAAFLNAVAGDLDQFGLFRRDMESGVVGGIERRAAGRGWSYRAKSGWERRPVTYLTWFALARYANWRHFGMPTGSGQVLGSTEGDATTGAYDTRAFPARPGAPFDPAKLPAGRNAGAAYFIPTADEWYKAAYFDPRRTGSRRYWDYPMRTDQPSLEQANHQAGEALGQGSPYFVAAVDDYAHAASASGTVQQGGNVWEWLEGWRSKGQGGCWRCDEWTRGMRGGSFNYTWRGLHAENTDPGAPDQAFFVYGGRLARIAPSTRAVRASPDADRPDEARPKSAR